ncbi:MAG: Gfo/Idh/MocA family oxidoreductase [Bryobacterales bacterium]
MKRGEIMSDQQRTRRDFVAGASAAAAAWTIIKPESVYGTPQNSKVKLGILGVGRRGSNIGQYFVRSDQVELNAIADIYDDQIKAAQEALPAKEAQVYKSAKAILDSDIDAIYIATPPYVHPEHFEMAVESGKHILMEKPVAVDPAGVRRVLAAAKKVKPNQMVMVDFQQRWGKDYREAYDRVKNGEIGDIRMIRSAWIGGDLPRRSGHPAADEKVLNWLFYKERSGDILVEQNCHNIDVVNWFTGVHPASVNGYGARAIRNDIGDIMDSLSVSFKLPDGRVYSHSANQFANGRYRDVGEYFFGTKGVISTSRGGYMIQVEGKEPFTKKTEYNINQDVVDHFIKGVQGQVPAENSAVFAAESTLTAIMARMAIDAGREMTWDEVFKM